MISVFQSFLLTLLEPAMEIHSFAYFHPHELYF